MSTKLTLLQYNVNKSRDKVLIGLLEDYRVARFDILAIQEPWRNTFNKEGYNPRNSSFYLIEETSERIRTAIYVNKRIPRSRISEIHKEKDLISLRISTSKEDIYIYNVYIGSTTYLAKDIPPILYNLKRLLENQGRYIILGDFNLHHPL
jgi:exonuclease III